MSIISRTIAVTGSCFSSRLRYTHEIYKRKDFPTLIPIFQPINKHKEHTSDKTEFKTHTFNNTSFKKSNTTQTTISQPFIVHRPESNAQLEQPTTFRKRVFLVHFFQDLDSCHVRQDPLVLGTHLQIASAIHSSHRGINPNSTLTRFVSNYAAAR